jgi:hypothetical protein
VGAGNGNTACFGRLARFMKGHILIGRCGRVNERSWNPQVRALARVSADEVAPWLPSDDAVDPVSGV